MADNSPASIAVCKEKTLRKSERIKLSHNESHSFLISGRAVGSEGVNRWFIVEKSLVDV